MDKKVKMISAIAIIIVLVIIGILLIFFFITESKCQCGNSDFDSFAGTWEALSTPRTETTYYLNGSWETKYLDISRTYNGTWEIKNNSITSNQQKKDYNTAQGNTYSCKDFPYSHGSLSLNQYFTNSRSQCQWVVIIPLRLPSPSSNTTS